MPYISQDERKMIKDDISKILVYVDEYTTTEMLNYIISVICHAACEGREQYSRFNEIIGVLECCKQEFYRKVITPYEDKKIQENGDLTHINVGVSNNTYTLRYNNMPLSSSTGR